MSDRDIPSNAESLDRAIEYYDSHVRLGARGAGMAFISDPSLRETLALLCELRERRASETAATRRQVPWNDFSGKPIFEGDEIVHPDGVRGRVIFVEGCTYPNDAWRVDYADGGMASRLCLQIGEKGQGVVAVKTGCSE